MGVHLNILKYRFIGKFENNKIFKHSQKFLALLIFLVTLIFIFAPFKSQEFIYQWVPRIDGNEVRITLIDTNPSYFELQIPCKIFREDSNWILEAKGGKALLIALKENGLTVTLGHQSLDEVALIELNEKLSNCELAFFTYSASSREVGLRVNNKSVNQVVPDDLTFEIASYLMWNPEIPNENVQVLIKTKPDLLIVPGPLKTLMINIIFIVMILCISVLSYLGLKKYEIKLYLSEIISFLFLIILGLVIYPMADDGFYLLTAKVFQETGILTQYQYPVPYPVGFFPALINGLFIQEFTSILLIRIFPLLVALTFWMVFYRNWVCDNLYLKNKEILLLWGIWALFTSAFYVTLRAEPYVALFFIIALTLVKRYQVDRPDLIIFLTVPLAVFSVSFHQSGIIVPFALLPIWLINTFKLNWKRLNFLYLSLSFAISSVTLFINSDPLLLLEKVKDFESVLYWSQPFPGEFAWGYSPLMEYVRLRHIANATPLQTLSILIFFIVLAFLILLFFSKIKSLDSNNFNKYLIHIALITAPLGLIFAPSKWSGHYSPLLVVTLVGIILLIQTKNNIKYLYVSILLIGSLTLLRPWVAGGNNYYSLDLMNTLIFNLHYYVVQNRINIFMFALFIGILLLTFFIKINTYYPILVVILIFVAIFKQALPPAVDSIAGNEGWTMNRQIVLGFFDSRARCGLFNEETLNQYYIKRTDKFVLNSDFINSPCIDPVGLSNGVWEYPDYSIGTIPLWDQQRLANRSEIKLVHCFEPMTRIYNPNFETCIYSWKSEIPELKLLSKTQ